MDISMGVPDEGIQATAKIRELFPEIKIIMFTISDKDELIFDAFKSGAMGYLLKNESPEFIVKTIMDVKSGEAQMSPSVARKTIHFLTGSKLPEKSQAEDFALSSRELETINLVAKGYTYTQIGELLHIAPSTAKKHMTNIFEKLHVKNKIEALLKTEAYREAHQH
jgi:DNA-binding NarL/FixJ family response regulator